ncbi:tRNA 2-selenouridine(34) synthase MnmH [Vibrio stylophorae]|nr:tRNA 2-selenouridine(34) synthase MnmH [Vibrio stylophorae]
MTCEPIEIYRDIFVHDRPLMDTRAPIEYSKGSFPLATNLPLMTDDERAQVGTCYKQQGQEAAIALGHQLVHGEIKAARVQAWRQFCEQHPTGYLFCFRGGMRSQITQSWLKESGLDYRYVPGGYKAMRRFLIDDFERQMQQNSLVVLGGHSGNGKTILLNELANGLDLEGAAHHRGSAFGQFVNAPSTQINFENQLAIDALKINAQGFRSFIVEDEGRNIGASHLPLSLYHKMEQAEIVVIDDPLGVRLGRLCQEYVVQMHQQYQQAFGEEAGWHHYCEYLQQSLFKTRRRLGLERYEQLSLALNQALKTQARTEQVDGHYAWLEPMVRDYYDPMYDYQLNQKKDRIIFQGNYADVKAYFTHQADAA